MRAIRKAVIALLLTAVPGVTGFAGIAAAPASARTGDLVTAADVRQLFGGKWLASGGTWLNPGDEETGSCGPFDPTAGYDCELHGEAADDGWPTVGIGIPPVSTDTTLLEHIASLWGTEDPPAVVLDAVPEVGDEAYLVTGTDLLGSILVFRAGGANVAIQYRSALDRPHGFRESKKANRRLADLGRVVAARLAGAPSGPRPPAKATSRPVPSAAPRTPPPSAAPRTPPPPTPTATEVPRSPSAADPDQSLLDVWSIEVHIKDHYESEVDYGTATYDVLASVHFTAGARWPSGAHRGTFEIDDESISPHNGCTLTSSGSGSGDGYIDVDQLAAGEAGTLGEPFGLDHYDIDQTRDWTRITVFMSAENQPATWAGCGRDQAGYDNPGFAESLFLPGTIAELLAVPIGTVYEDTQVRDDSDSAAEVPWVHLVTITYTATKVPRGSGLAEVAGDSDRDGWSDAEEAAVGTDPADPVSHPLLTFDYDSTSFPASGVGDIGITCGDAKHDFYEVTLEPTTVSKGEYACVMLLSNSVANELLDAALENKSTLTDMAGRYIKDNLGVIAADIAPKAAYSAALLAGRLYAAKVFPQAASMLRSTNAIFLSGVVATYSAVALHAAVVIDQIRSKGGCIQLRVNVEGSELIVDWSLVYNPAHFTERSGSFAHVYDRDERRFRLDDAVRQELNLQCTEDGAVEVGELEGDTTKAFDRLVSAVLSLPPDEGVPDSEELPGVGVPGS